MKKLLFLLLLLCSVFISVDIHAQGTRYTIHTIAQGETLSALAQKYHTTVGDIMRLNGLHAKSQLMIGQKIKIPSAGGKETPDSVAKMPSAPAANSDVATHYVLQGETLYSISKKFGVTVDQLKQWNNLSNENIHFGQLLAVSSEGVAMIATKNPDLQKKEEQKADTTNTETKNTADTIKEKKENTDTSKQLIAKAVSVDVVPMHPLPAQDSSSKDTGNGFFAKDFPGSNNLKNISGDAMTFKTNSGWSDEKYYILTNEVPSGSIVKVSSPNGKSLYAKVLWKLEDMKLNEGLTFRVSDAAASVLGINESKFRLTVEW